MFDKISHIAVPNTVIPKPKAKGDFIVKGLGKRRGESAIIYFIPNHKDPRRPFQKGVTKSELESSDAQLRTSGEFTRQWFNKNLHRCAAEGGCNFTTIGGLFELAGIARDGGKGRYVRRDLRG
jgi:hypothetical protein